VGDDQSPRGRSEPWFAVHRAAAQQRVDRGGDRRLTVRPVACS
jgi:hypothetical protein